MYGISTLSEKGMYFSLHIKDFVSQIKKTSTCIHKNTIYIKTEKLITQSALHNQIIRIPTKSVLILVSHVYFTEFTHTVCVLSSCMKGFDIIFDFCY